MLKRRYDQDQMTKSVWRFLLTCLLLAALPSQGFAAMGMAVCGPNHHEGFVSLTLAGSADKRAVQNLPDQASHHHAMASDGPDAGEQMSRSTPSSPEAGSPISTGKTDNHFKCKNCAPCCASAMLTSEVVTPVARSAGKTDFPDLVTTLTFPPPGSLDRPPRLLLA